MKILLARHGNTFAPGETPVRVGANEDLPLTSAGEAQARALAKAMVDADLIPDAYVTGPLKRTRRHAEILAGTFGDAVPEIDDRLREIDYGPWGGLSDDDIIYQFGPRAAEELAAWNAESRWPTDTVTWQPGATAVAAALKSMVAELETRFADHPNATVLICSSNGILRYFLDLTPDGLAAHQSRGEAKMATGAASLLMIENGQAQVLFWNVKAGDALPPS